MLGSKYVNEKIQKLGFLKPRAENIYASIESAKKNIINNFVNRGIKPVDSDVLNEMSDVYSLLIFHNKNFISSNPEIQKKMLEQYNDKIINNFQTMFNDNAFLEQIQAVNLRGNSSNYLAYNKNANIAKGLQSVLDKTNTISIGLFNNFQRSINNLFNDMSRILGSNNPTVQNLRKVNQEINLLSQKINDAAKQGLQNKDGTMIAGQQKHVYYLNNTQYANQLTNLINDYYQIMVDSEISKDINDQGLVGEAVIAAANNYINGISLNTIDSLLKWGGLKVGDKKSKWYDTKKSARDKARSGLGWTSLVQVENADFQVNKNVFDVTTLKIDNFDIKTGNIKIGDSDSTADVEISWKTPNFNETGIGASVKNYKKGIRSNEINLVKGVNLLTILNLTSNSYFGHFMNQTSILHKKYPEIESEINSSDNANKSSYTNFSAMKEVLRLGLLVRGLSGIRKDQIGHEKGEARIIFIIDDVKKRVDVYSTTTIINNILDLAEHNLSGLKGIIHMSMYTKGDDDGKKEQVAIKIPFYENKYVMNVANRGKMERSSWAAAQRANGWLVEAAKIKMSASLNPNAKGLRLI